MSVAIGPATSELLAELRRLCARFPRPQPGWHPFGRQIAACRSDFERALVLAADSPETLAHVAELVDGQLEPVFDPDASPALSAAWHRLEVLPIPDGQHPYLDDILLALEALRLLLVALSHSDGG